MEGFFHSGKQTGSQKVVSLCNMKVYPLLLKMAGWMDDLQFYILLTVFQSYQDDEKVIMKAVCNGTSFTIGKIFLLSRT